MGQRWDFIRCNPPGAISHMSVIVQTESAVQRSIAMQPSTVQTMFRVPYLQVRSFELSAVKVRVGEVSPGELCGAGIGACEPVRRRAEENAIQSKSTYDDFCHTV